MTNPFRAPGEWLKAALHTHSTESDGTLPPARLVTTYEEAGFDVVAITDHWRLTEVPSTNRVLTVRGAELGWDLARPSYPTQWAEFLVYGIDHLPYDPGGDRANWYTNPEEHYEVRHVRRPHRRVRVGGDDGRARVRRAPVLERAARRRHRLAGRLRRHRGLDASAEDETGRGDSSPWWDALLRTGRPVMGIATNNQHYPLFELGAAWTMVRAAERTEAAVLDALRAGGDVPLRGAGDPRRRGERGRRRGRLLSGAPGAAAHGGGVGHDVSVGRHGRRNGRILETDGRGLITRVLLDRQGERLYEATASSTSTAGVPGPTRSSPRRPRAARYQSVRS